MLIPFLNTTAIPDCANFAKSNPTRTWDWGGRYWAAGEYTWVLQASRGAERNTLQTGRTTVRPDPAAAGTAATNAAATAAGLVSAAVWEAPCAAENAVGMAPGIPP